MKTFLFASLCTAFAASSASAVLLSFTADLQVANTNPAATFPNPQPDPLPSGFANVSLDTETRNLAWSIEYQDLSGPVVSPGAHFHGPAPIGTNAGVKVFIANGDPNGPLTGNFTGNATVSLDDVADIQNELWYVNFHTAQNPSGEIRGQVLAVPEPGALLLVAGTLPLFVLRRRR